MDADYHCKERKRRVLHAGCVYRSPVYMCAVSYYPKNLPAYSARPEAYLDSLFANISYETNREFRESRDRHLALLRDCATSLSFEYFPRVQAMRANGNPLCNGVTAVVLAKILRLNKDEAKTHFDYREFKYDLEIFADPKRTSFETHLNRIVDALTKSVYGMSIVKVGRGRFDLKAACALEFNERS